MPCPNCDCAETNARTYRIKEGPAQPVHFSNCTMEFLASIAGGSGGPQHEGIPLTPLCDITTGAHVGFLAVVRTEEALPATAQLWFDPSGNPLTAAPSNSEKCSEIEYELQQLCDDNGAFMRLFQRETTTGALQTFNYTLAGATYTPVGSVVVCSDFEAEQRCLQDDTLGDGTIIVTFIRHTVYDNAGAVSSTYDTLPDMVTLYVIVGTVSECSFEKVEVEVVDLCDKQLDDLVVSVVSNIRTLPNDVINYAPPTTRQNIATNGRLNPTRLLQSTTNHANFSWEYIDTITGATLNSGVNENIGGGGGTMVAWEYEEESGIYFTLVWRAANNTARVGYFDPVAGTGAESAQLPIPAGHTVTGFAITTNGLAIGNDGIDTVIWQIAGTPFAPTGFFEVARFAGVRLGGASANNGINILVTNGTTIEETTLAGVVVNSWTAPATILGLDGAKFDRQVPFLRHLTYADDGLTVVNTYDTFLDGVTPYVPMGTVGQCNASVGSETEQLILCDTAQPVATSDADLIYVDGIIGSRTLVTISDSWSAGCVSPAVLEPDYTGVHVDTVYIGVSPDSSTLYTTPALLTSSLETWDRATQTLTASVALSGLGSTINGIAVDPTTGILYISISGNQVYTVDIITGIATVVYTVAFNVGGAGGHGIAFDSTGQMYYYARVGVGSYDLHKINKATGVSEGIVLNTSSGQVLGYDPNQDFMYLGSVAYDVATFTVQTPVCPLFPSTANIQVVGVLPLTGNSGTGTSVKFVRHTVYDTGTGSVIVVFDTELDMTTPYTAAGTVNECADTPAVSWTSGLCDNGAAGVPTEGVIAGTANSNQGFQTFTALGAAPVPADISLTPPRTAYEVFSFGHLSTIGNITAMYYAEQNAWVFETYDGAGTQTLATTLTGIGAGERLLSMEVHPVTGVLYAYAYNAGVDGYIYTIDPLTGTATLVGGTGFVHFASGGGLAITPSGAAYVVIPSGTSQVYSIDLNTGVGTFVIDIEAAIGTSVGVWTGSKVDETLWARAGNTSDYIQIDTTLWTILQTVPGGTVSGLDVLPLSLGGGSPSITQFTRVYTSDGTTVTFVDYGIDGAVYTPTGTVGFC